MSIHYRIQPEGEFLKEEDYKLLRDGKRYGFGLDFTQYNAVVRAREEYNKTNPGTYVMREDLYKVWDARTGIAIDGKPFKTKPHELHKVMLTENETGKEYHIDCVMEQHYFGYYTALLVREKGTLSHGTVYWNNINCKDPVIIDGIEETKKRFK